MLEPLNPDAEGFAVLGHGRKAVVGKLNQPRAGRNSKLAVHVCLLAAWAQLPYAETYTAGATAG